MGLLAENTIDPANISSALTAISYSHISADPKTAIARVDLSNVAGNGSYLIRMYLNGQEVDPEFGMSIGGITAFSSVSRPFSVQVGDIVLVKVTGLPADTAVHVHTTLTEIAVTKQGVLEALGEFFPQDVAVDTSSVSASLQTCINGWAAALALDSVSPQPSYSVDGETYYRNEWRKMLFDLIKETTQMINALNPYCVITRQVLR